MQMQIPELVALLKNYMIINLTRKSKWINWAKCYVLKQSAAERKIAELNLEML
ncbi:MAG: hypothetical protein Kow0029_16520 [Candidatus Rifleibacteriota bacterium]